MGGNPEQSDAFPFIGGCLCLDFANTVRWHAGEHPGERLIDFAQLVRWGLSAGVLEQVRANRLLRDAKTHPARAAAALTRAVKARETMYRIFAAVSRGRRPDTGDLEGFNRLLAGSLARSRIGPTHGGFAWEWAGAEEAWDIVLWHTLRSAADLLTSKALPRVGQCVDDRGCGWLFLDTSRNHSRRWCDMKDCGNREKARGHYARMRASRLHGLAIVRR
jgi:predicted RNA-binding Zn ribbon-like protein